MELACLLTMIFLPRSCRRCVCTHHGARRQPFAGDARRAEPENDVSTQRALRPANALRALREMEFLKFAGLASDLEMYWMGLFCVFKKE
ncbi:hypothetical protein EVAR_44762_1 [Eumeta japonica]|uniref:Uncharacterized protein n=1 Tax=Eumeta variegata TaxID=151549 RepID=A0A4C1XHR3_EUMVA|nr:hypothetical protein EVAR_44762_1 [Eumeta japonica]